MTDQIRPPPDEWDDLSEVTRQALAVSLPSQRKLFAKLARAQNGNGHTSGTKVLYGVLTAGVLAVAGAAWSTYLTARDTSQTVESELPRLRAEAAQLREASEDEYEQHERYGHPETARALALINERLGRIETKLETIDRRRRPGER